MKQIRKVRLGFIFCLILFFVCVDLYADSGTQSYLDEVIAREKARQQEEELIRLSQATDQNEETAEVVVSPVSSQQEQEAQQESYLPYVSDIVVMGNQIISSNTILNKIKTQRGRTLSREVINQDIKRLYATGYFQDVRFDLVPDGRNYKVVLVVDEKAVVKEVKVVGNNVFSAEALLKDVNLESGVILDQHVLKEGINNIRKRYEQKGYKFVDVSSHIDISPYTKEAVVTITVDEGKRYNISDIRFEGVTEYKSSFLRSKMQTKKKNWLLFRSGVFNDKKFQTDLERLAYIYQRDGYLDVALRPSFEYNETDKTMTVVITVQEGAQYITGDVNIRGNRLFPESEIWGQLEMLPGEVYSQIRLHEDVDALRRFYFEHGYINAKITPETNLNKKTGRVDIKYSITEGELYYIDKVKVRGNTKTKDIVIRRELRVHPGEQFDGEKLDYSKQRLNNLGYFEEVEYETEPGTAPNKRDVVFRVKEKQTGELSFGAGISSIDQFIGFAEISQRNFDFKKWPTFTGGGQNLSLRGRWGSVTRDVDFNFVEPYLFNKPISMGINIYNWERESNNLDFDTRRRGFNITFGKNFTDRVKGSLGYTLENVKITNVSTDAHPDVTASGEENNLSRVKASISYDSRDNVFAPTKGWYLSASSELVGSALGGDEDFASVQLAATKFISFKEDHVIQLKGRLGGINDFGDSKQVPVFDRFYAGGLGTVRGFGYRRVGPKGGGDPIGGETLVLGSVEYMFPIIENFKGAVFVDAGHVNSEFAEVDMGDFAVSIGPGLRINTPLGPITFYYGFPVANRDDEDEYGRFEFNLSRGF